MVELKPMLGVLENLRKGSRERSSPEAAPDYHTHTKFEA